MSVSTADVKRATDTAHVLESQGYFAKAKSGDEKGASYFARLVASTVNPSGNPHDWGWLRKTGGGFNVEGYADGAIVFGNDPANLFNVLKIVTQVGSPDPNAIQIGDAVQQRRDTDIWEVPIPVPESLTAYLGGSHPTPPQPPQATQPPGREEALDELHWLDAYYASPEGLQRPNGLSLGGKPDFEGIAAWYLDVYQRARMAMQSRADARAAYVRQIRHSAEWQAKHPGETP